MGNSNKKLTLPTNTGNDETEMCYGGEASVHKHVAVSKKNSEHKCSLPIKDFHIHCLPLLYHDNLMSETIKALVALTVQVKIKFTSLERPEFYPGTQKPYPCYKDRGCHVMRLGTGRLIRVYKSTVSDGTCRCAKCQVCATPSKVWGKVFVLTATDVVFDDNEARQTRCVLAYGNKKCPVVSLDAWEMERTIDVERKMCELSYATCDLELVDELDRLCRRFNDLCWEVRNKCGQFINLDKLTVIVSHPHGCSKQNSVGQWTHKRERVTRTTWTRYWYTTCACPGSSIAPVYMKRCDVLPYDHQHS